MSVYLIFMANQFLNYDEVVQGYLKSRVKKYFGFNSPYNDEALRLLVKALQKTILSRDHNPKSFVVISNPEDAPKGSSSQIIQNWDEWGPFYLFSPKRNQPHVGKTITALLEAIGLIIDLKQEGKLSYAANQFVKVCSHGFQDFSEIAPRANQLLQAESTSYFNRLVAQGHFEELSVAGLESTQYRAFQIKTEKAAKYAGDPRQLKNCLRSHWKSAYSSDCHKVFVVADKKGKLLFAFNLLNNCMDQCVLKTNDPLGKKHPYYPIFLQVVRQINRNQTRVFI